MTRLRTMARPREHRGRRRTGLWPALAAVALAAGCAQAGEPKGLPPAATLKPGTPYNPAAATAVPAGAPATAGAAAPGCRADATFGTGGDFDPAHGARLGQAFQAIPTDGTLGILEGDYVLSRQAAGIWRRMKGGAATICGLGARPSIRVAEGPTASWAVGQASRLTVANLDLRGIEITTPGTLDGDLHLEGLVMGGTRNECLTTSPVRQAGRPVEGNRQGDPTEFHMITLRDVAFIACSGRAGSDHAVYIATRGCVLRAERVRLEHPGGLEGFRSLCRINVISDSTFSNVLGDPAAAGPGTPHGAAPLQVVGCAATILRDSRLDVVGDSGKTGLWVSARRSITGCDMPNWTPQGAGGAFWDPAFWAKVNRRPITDPLNPHIFPLFISGSTFAFHDTGAPGGNNVAIKDAGTYPTRRSAAYSTTSIYKAVPKDDPATAADDGWRERHVVLTANNTFTGWDAAFVGAGFGAPAHRDSDPGALIPPHKPPRLRVEVGGDKVGGDDGGADIELPAWWPRSCEDLRRYDWFDEGAPDGQGRPPCG